MPTEPDAKSDALRQHSSLNPHPDAVTDGLFQDSSFFDARDLVLVKYEMLRRVRVDGLSITEAANAFGFSRPAFYQAQAAFEEKGLPGLIPKRPGPRRAHKLSVSVMDFVEDLLLEDKALPTAALVSAVEERFELSVHPRSIERALGRRRKKGL
jgi:transposase